MLRKSHGGLKSPKKEERRGRLRREGNKIKVIDLRFEKVAGCKIQESKKKTRRAINCTFLGWMMIYGIAFVDW